MLTEFPLASPVMPAGSEIGLKLIYTLLTNRFDRGELPPYTAYGVEISLSRPGQNDETARVEDITTDRAKAERFLALLRRNGVTPVTLRDVIEDMLGV